MEVPDDWIGKEAVFMAVKGIGLVSSAPKSNTAQAGKSSSKGASKSASKNVTKSSTEKSKGSGSSSKQMKSSTSKQTKSSDAVKATAKSSQGASTNKKNSGSLTSLIEKSVMDAAKEAAGKETKKPSITSAKSSVSQVGKTTGQSGKNVSGVTNSSSTKMIAGKQTTYATGAAGIYNGKGQVVSGVKQVANQVVASVQIIGYNSSGGGGNTSATSFNRPLESYKTVKNTKKTSTAKPKGKTITSYITKPNGTERRVVVKKPSPFQLSVKKYGGKIKYVVTDGQVRSFTSFCAGFTPVAGDVLDIVDAVTGKDIITGKKLSLSEQGITLVALLPVVTGPAARGALKGVKSVSKTKKVKIFLRNSDKVDEAADAGKQVIKGDGKKKVKEGAGKLAEKTSSSTDKLEKVTVIKKGEALIKTEKYLPPNSTHSINVYTDGKAMINTGKIDKYIRGIVELDVEETKKRIKELESIKKVNKEKFTKSMKNELQTCKDKLHNYQRSKEMSKTLNDAGIVNSTENNRMIVENLLNTAKRANENNTELISYIKGTHGEVQVVSRWKILNDHTPYLATIILKPVK